MTRNKLRDERHSSGGRSNEKQGKYIFFNCMEWGKKKCWGRGLSKISRIMNYFASFSFPPLYTIIFWVEKRRKEERRKNEEDSSKKKKLKTKPTKIEERERKKSPSRWRWNMDGSRREKERKMCSIIESGSEQVLWNNLSRKKEILRVEGRERKKERERNKKEKMMGENLTIPWVKMVTELKKRVPNVRERQNGRKERKKEKMVCNLNWILNHTFFIPLSSFPILYTFFWEKLDFGLWCWERKREEKRNYLSEREGEKLSSVIIHFRKRRSKPFKRFQDKSRKEKSDHIKKKYHFTFSSLSRPISSSHILILSSILLTLSLTKTMP